MSCGYYLCIVQLKTQVSLAFASVHFVVGAAKATWHNSKMTTSKRAGLYTMCMVERISVLS